MRSQSFNNISLTDGRKIPKKSEHTFLSNMDIYASDGLQTLQILAQFLTKASMYQFIYAEMYVLGIILENVSLIKL